MAQQDEVQRNSDASNDQRVEKSMHFKGSNAQTAPTFQQLLQRDGSKWSHIASQMKKKNHGQEDDRNQHNKKSVLAKVKEKAKKLKFSLRGKKHGDKNESPGSSSRSSKGDEDSIYYSARSGATEAYPKVHTPLDSSVVATADSDTRSKTTLTTDVTKGYESQERNSRFSGLMTSTLESSKNKSERSVEEGDDKTGESQKRDKGVSVKEYLMNKFEPSEDERALSKVITQTINPRRDKVRDAMSAFLKNDESSEPKSSNAGKNVNFETKSLPASTKESHNLGSNASKASMSLNQTFKTTFASYQDHFLGSSSNRSNRTTSINPGSNQSSLGPTSGVSDTQASVSSAMKTRARGNVATSVRRIPVSRPGQTRVPSHAEPNTAQGPVSTANRTDGYAARTPISTGHQGRFVYDNDRAIASLSAYCKNQQCMP